MADEITNNEAPGLLRLSGNHADSPLVEITARIRPDQALALELLENAGRQRLGTGFDKDQLIQEALDLLIEKSLVAVRLATNT